MSGDMIQVGWRELLGLMVWVLFFGGLLRVVIWQEKKLKMEMAHPELVKVSKKVKR